MRNFGLTLVLLAIFAVTMCGQWLAGWKDYNDEQRAHHLQEVGCTEYLATGHFWQATAENWESEFLQMSAFIVLTTFLYQKGSPESNDPDKVEADTPVQSRNDPTAPWPVRRGGWVLKLYSHSLSIFFLLVFVLCFALHVVGGHKEYVHSQMLDGQPAPSVMAYVTSGRFWFESMQNWQSEFLSLAAMVYMSVYLRERGSAESKRVAASHTAHD